MKFVKIEYMTKSRMNLKAISGFGSEAIKRRFEIVGKFKPLILRISIGDDNLVFIEDFDVITIQGIQRIAGYQPSKEFALHESKDDNNVNGVSE